MKLPVEIMVTNKRLDYRDLNTSGDIPEPRESTDSFTGYMVVNGKRVSIDYTEDFDDGEHLDTSVMLKDGVALISKRGDINTNLVFKAGQSCDCICYNGYRQMSLRVNTHKMSSDIGPLGGKLTIDYTVEIMGNLAEKNSICVSVCPTDAVS